MTVSTSTGPPSPARFDRRLSHPGREKSREADARTPGELDRDRILYTSTFRRLAGVTQVAGAVEGHVFHNRLTHTLEVAQVARRLAERFLRTEPLDLITALGGLDADVVEAAALAHDLGHPPFGHIAEHTLDVVSRHKHEPDGFEGNAQSFRIVTRLTAHRDKENYEGLNLTRATLNAILKYPFRRGENPDKPNKFGAYTSENDWLEFARAMEDDDRQSLEAAIMDHADGVAYSVHDLDDFYRAGLIPLQEVWADLEGHIQTFKASKKVSEERIDRNLPAIREMAQYMPTHHRYEGTYEERAELRASTSTLINLFVSNAALGSPQGPASRLSVPDVIDVQMRFLQHLVWRYVILNPRLATQQRGQEHIIATLFDTYHGAIVERNSKLVPAPFHKQLNALGPKESQASGIPGREARLAADIVASFTDNQAGVLFRRLTGVATGSVTDLLES